MDSFFKDFVVIEVPPTEENRKEDQFDYWKRFTQAEKDGIEAVKKTFGQIIRECHQAEKPYINLTELYIIANHKVWQHYKTNKELAAHYDNMQRSGYEYISNNFTKEELDYFYTKTD